LANNDEDIKLLSDMIIAAMDNVNRPMSNFDATLNLFFLVCYTQKNVASAKEMFHNEVVIASGYIANCTILKIRYFTLLYEQELYQDLVDDFRTIEDPSLDEFTLAMAALCKIGTPEAFQESTDLFRRHTKNSKTGKGRYRFIYAYFASQRGEYGMAYDAISARFGYDNLAHPSMTSTNMKLHVLIEAERLDDALNIIRTDLLAGDPSYKIVSFEVMSKLTTAVKSSGDSSMTDELTRLCQVLDDKANLTDQGIESIVFSPIKEVKKKTKAPPRSRRYDDDDDDGSSRAMKPRRRDIVTDEELA
jgi:hypothetical protein